MSVVPRIRQFSAHRFRNYSRDRLLKNVQRADIVYSARRQLFPRRFPLRSPTIIHHANHHRHRECRSPHRRMFTLASVYFRPKSSSAYFIDSYGIVPLVPTIQAFIKRNCMTWDYNRRQLQVLTAEVCGTFCCLFALYMYWGYTPQQFISLFIACNHAD